ncbi:MAG: hypothetical protein FJW96_03140 [Actinobacteria bacterium]|nr:hypothetical protein [Actinomycetota bacterium]
MPAPLVTQTQLLDQLAGKLGGSRADAKRTLTAVEDVVLDNLREARRIKIGNTVQLEVRLKAATSARKGRNPATGEEITIAARPASVDVRARPLKGAKEAVPTIEKAKKVIGG